MNLKEEQMLSCPDCGAEPPDWAEKDKSKKWSAKVTGPRWHCAKCDAYLIIMDRGVEHMPELEDDVVAWLRQVRDEILPLVQSDHQKGGLEMLELLIEQYRAMASERQTLADYRRSSLSARSGT